MDETANGKANAMFLPLPPAAKARDRRIEEEASLLPLVMAVRRRRIGLAMEDDRIIL